MKKTILIITLASIFSSCNEAEISVTQDENHNTKIELTPEEYASIAYSKQDELSSTEVMNILNQFEIQIGKKAKSRSNSSSNYIIKEKYYFNTNEASVTTPSRTATDTSTLIPIYKVALTNQNEKGIAIISADKRCPRVIAYMPSHSNDNFNKDETDIMLDLAMLSISDEIKYYNLLKDSLESKTLEKIGNTLNINDLSFDNLKDKIQIKSNDSRAVTPVGVPQGFIGPLTKTNWGQEGPYNLQLEMKSSYMHANAGCANTAIAQILAWIEPSMTVKDNIGNNIYVNWNYLKTEEQIRWNILNANDPTNSPKDKVDMVGFLYKNIYEGTHSTILTNGQTNTKTADFVSYLNKYAIFSKQKNFESAAAKSSIENLKLVAVLGESATGAHIWLLDGILICSKTTRELVNNYNVYFHANFGWGDKNSGYYQINQNLSVDFLVSDGKKYTNLRMYNDIAKR